jgi:hypothetical protein
VPKNVIGKQVTIKVQFDLGGLPIVVKPLPVQL